MGIAIGSWQQLEQIDEKYEAADDFLVEQIGTELGKPSPDWKEISYLFAKLVENEFKELTEMYKFGKKNHVDPSILGQFMQKLQYMISSIATLITSVENQKGSIFAGSLPPKKTH